MDLGRFVPSSYFNWNLAKEPMNWAIVWTFASLWLLLFHVVMTAWQSMMAGPEAIAAGPGQIAMLPDATEVFSVQGSLAGPQLTTGLDRFLGGGPQYWGDGSVAKYAEDGWYANP